MQRRIASALARRVFGSQCVDSSICRGISTSSSSSSSRSASGALAGTSSSLASKTTSSAPSTTTATIDAARRRSLFFSSSSAASFRRAFSAEAKTAAGAGAENDSPSPPHRGPVSYVSLALTMATGAGIVFYYDHLKQKKVRAALENAAKKSKSSSSTTAGAAAIGGPFALVDASGKPFTEKDLVGKGWHLLYFGFTRCPDICPDELEKIAAATCELEERLEKNRKGGGRRQSERSERRESDDDDDVVTPVFISVDPERDPPSHVGSYVREFHPRMIGLTGTVAQCRGAARAYRVYYARAAASPGSEEEEGEQGGTGGGGGVKKNENNGGKNKNNKIAEDYLIDHSIITYLIDPAGNFVTFYGKNVGKEEMVESVLERMEEWRQGRGKEEEAGE